MPNLSPRLGYYIISFGTLLQFLGLTGNSWLSDASTSGTLSFSRPGDVLLVLGMSTSVLGILAGFYSFSDTIPIGPERTPRLLPAMPLVLLVVLSIGTVAFAHQVGQGESSSASAASVNGEPGALPTPFVIEPEGPGNCNVEGTIWHEVMGHCMTPDAIAAFENAICPAGYKMDPLTLTCLPEAVTVDGSGNPVVTTGGTGAPGTGIPVCPIGFFWHLAMDHCMELSEVSCPAGYVWDMPSQSCVTTASDGTIATPPPDQTPQCPAGTFWHPDMVHCMSNECPDGFEYNYEYLICIQVGPPPPRTPTPTPIATPTLPPGQTPTPPPEQTPTQTPAPTPTQTPSPQCPSGYFWHPAMNHCMSDTCPPGLVFDYESLFCLLPGETTPTPVAETAMPTASPTPAATMTPTATPAPQCPSGYFWHPAMNHCMSEDCPPGLVFDYDTLFCVIPS